MFNTFNIINDIYSIKILSLLNNDKNNKLKINNINKNKRVFSPKQYTRLSRNDKTNYNLQINNDYDYMNNSMINSFGKNSHNFSGVILFLIL